MYYNFYVYLIVLAILSPVIAFNKEIILKKFTLTNDIFYTSLFIVIVVGLKKIYVCSSAIFPTSGSVNPTMTVCALSNRLGDHLKKYL